MSFVGAIASAVAMTIALINIVSVTREICELEETIDNLEDRINRLE